MPLNIGNPAANMGWGTSRELWHLRRMNRPLAGVAAGSLAIVAAVAGCSASSTSGHASDAASSPATTSSAAPTTVTTTPTRPATPTATPSGLTPTGSTLSVGQAAKVAYELDTLSKETTTLAIDVKTVRAGTIGDLRNFQLDAQSKTGVPFYVTASFTNVGAKTVKPSGIFGTVDALDVAGDKLPELNLIGDFPKCEGTAPDQLAPGASYTDCQVYIAPAGHRVAKVVFDHFVDTATSSVETKITWTV